MDITPLGVQYEDVQDKGAPPSSAGLAPDVTVTESSPMATEDRVLGRDSPDAGQPVVPSEEPVQVFGYLQKQGRRLKGWHQRWFEIRGQHMYYYKTNAKKHCLGEIELSICTHVHPVSTATFGHPFELMTQERSHILAARTVDDMEKWVDAVKRNMGPRPGPKPKKIAKVKKWDSFKGAFAIRHRSASPQRSLDLPTASLPADVKKKVEVSRNRSFLEKLGIKRDRSESPSSRRRSGVALRSPEEKKDSLPRPLSENVHYIQQQTQLQARLVDPPTAISVPNTPLAKKRQEDVGHDEQTSQTPSTQTPGGSSGPSLEGTPEPVVKDTSSVPKHTSTPMVADKETPPNRESPPVIFAKPRPLVKNSNKSPKTRQQNMKKPTLSTPDEGALPEILTQPLAWDDIKQMLASLPEESGPLFVDTLPPEQESWMDKDTPIEQLREFLAVCA